MLSQAPAALVDEFRGGVPSVCGGVEDEKCVDVAVPRRRRMISAFDAPLDADADNCMLPRCDGNDVEGGGYWMREGMEVSEGGSCRQDSLFCYSRRPCCALATSTRGGKKGK